MAEKPVSVRLAAVGGRQVRAELEGVSEAGSRGFGRLSREMEAANNRLAAFSRRVAVQVGGRLVHRDPELVHQIAAVHMSLPEQAELYELEALLDPPQRSSELSLSTAASQPP